MASDDAIERKDTATVESQDSSAKDIAINPSGHKQELERNYGLWAIVGLVLSAGSEWIFLGGSLTIAMGSGGPMGVLYQL